MAAMNTMPPQKVRTKTVATPRQSVSGSGGGGGGARHTVLRSSSRRWSSHVGSSMGATLYLAPGLGDGQLRGVEPVLKLYLVIRLPGPDELRAGIEEIRSGAHQLGVCESASTTLGNRIAGRVRYHVPSVMTEPWFPWSWGRRAHFS